MSRLVRQHCTINPWISAYGLTDSWTGKWGKCLGRTLSTFHFAFTSKFAKMFDHLRGSSGLALCVLSISFRHSTAEDERLPRASFKQCYHPNLSELSLFWCWCDVVYLGFSLWPSTIPDPALITVCQHTQLFPILWATQRAVWFCSIPSTVLSRPWQKSHPPF